MKKIIHSLTLVYLVSMLWLSTALAAPAKPLFIEKDGQFAAIGQQAVMQGGVWLLPAAAVQEHIYANSQFHTDKQFVMQFGKSRLAVANKELERNFAYHITFRMPYQNIAKAGYIELEPASKMLGFDWRETDDGLYISPNTYMGFAPQVLDAVDRRLPSGERVCLAWQPTFGAEESLAHNEKKAGLNIVSPSWFAVTDKTGSIVNKASLEYVRQAHEKGYRVWPLVTNSFSPELTHQFLQDPAARQSMIRQLSYYLLVYEADGLNIDFENVYEQDRQALSDFVGELSLALRSLGLNSSIDVTMPSGAANWSRCYDRRALGEAVDYVMLMAYDEHWRTSPRSGSVASLPWVKQGVERTLQEVPAEKLVLGVPFYMRRWEENLAGKKVDARTLTMAQAEQEIKTRQLQPVWDEVLGQYYFEYRQDGRRYRVWQEESRSLGLKLDLAAQYGLAGIAAWRSGFETPDIWQQIGERFEAVVPVCVPQEEPDKKVKKKKRRHKVQETAVVKSSK